MRRFPITESFCTSSKKHFAKQFELEILEIDNIPLFNQDLKWDENFQLRLLYNKITRADGVIISTPEHNHTISPALKSVIEWLSYDVHPFENKPVMIVRRLLTTTRALLARRFICARLWMLRA